MLNFVDGFLYPRRLVSSWHEKKNEATASTASCLIVVLTDKFIIEIIIRFSVIFAFINGFYFLFLDLLEQAFQLFVVARYNHCIGEFNAKLNEAFKISRF